MLFQTLWNPANSICIYIFISLIVCNFILLCGFSLAWMSTVFKEKESKLYKPSPHFACPQLPRAVLVVVVAQFWIYNSAVPQIGLSKASLLFEEDP